MDSREIQIANKNLITPKHKCDMSLTNIISMR
jgi:hypothetical protein